MSVNLHDCAYDLEKAIRNSNEYNELREAYNAVNADEAARTMFDSFRNMQMEMQRKQMMGQEITQAEVEQAQETVERVQQHKVIGKLIEAEQRMSMVIADLNQIIMKPLEELYGPLDQQ